MLTEYIIFQNRGLVFYYSRDPPPSRLFTVFFLRSPSLRERNDECIELYFKPRRELTLALGLTACNWRRTSLQKGSCKTNNCIIKYNV